ncbi:MAG: glutathione S-transferase N-terminal domain-containing protein [Rhodobacteraceae bacterium]|nr:glutathione S-transferase N-terminal domain-containing protein [Paracoccaceae bacterium]
MTPVLHVFPFSNFCEKAQWALDCSGVEYETRVHWPGLHAKKIMTLSGQTSVPVLEVDSRIIAGSAAILDWIEADHAPGWTVSDEARAWEDRLDEVGGVLRAALFTDLLRDPPSMARLLLAGARGPKAWLYANAVMRMAAPKFRKMLAAAYPDPSAPERISKEMLAEIEASMAETGHIVGDSFTRADLTAAALFFPVVFPDGSPAAALGRFDPAYASWRKRWVGLGNWLGEAYRRR